MWSNAAHPSYIPTLNFLYVYLFVCPYVGNTLATATFLKAQLSGLRQIIAANAHVPEFLTPRRLNLAKEEIELSNDNKNDNISP